jgi:hypothetical protein
MSEPIFISGEAALRNFIQGIHADVDGQLDARNINASGALKKSNRTEVVTGLASSSATLYAYSYWTKAGSGSEPGTKVSPDALAKWAIDKGLANNERRALRIGLLVSRKILKEGSKQYREGGENVYANAVENAAPKVEAVLSAFLRDIPTALVREFKTLAS